MLRESQRGHVVTRSEIKLVTDLTRAWWLARYQDKRALIGYLCLPGGEKYEVLWAPNYGVISPDFCTSNGSFTFIIECCPDGTKFEQKYQERE